jgi:nickel/cobalt transporter (NiCoT) family protein
MMLFDTLDGAFMNFAYGWAFARPVRKVYYNLVIIALSIGAAFIIGTIEILGILTTEIHLHSAFWNLTARRIRLRLRSGPLTRAGPRAGTGRVR